MTLPSVSLAASTSFEFKPLVNKSHFSKTLLASALALSFMRGFEFGASGGQCYA